MYGQAYLTQFATQFFVVVEVDERRSIQCRQIDGLRQFIGLQRQGVLPCFTAPCERVIFYGTRAHARVNRTVRTGIGEGFQISFHFQFRRLAVGFDGEGFDIRLRVFEDIKRRILHSVLDEIVPTVVQRGVIIDVGSHDGFFLYGVPVRQADERNHLNVPFEDKQRIRFVHDRST